MQARQGLQCKLAEQRRAKRATEGSTHLGGFRPSQTSHSVTLKPNNQRPSLGACGCEAHGSTCGTSPGSCGALSTSDSTAPPGRHLLHHCRFSAQLLHSLPLWSGAGCVCFFGGMGAARGQASGKAQVSNQEPKDKPLGSLCRKKRASPRASSDLVCASTGKRNSCWRLQKQSSTAYKDTQVSPRTQLGGSCGTHASFCWIARPPRCGFTADVVEPGAPGTSPCEQARSAPQPTDQWGTWQWSCSALLPETRSPPENASQ